MSVRLIQIVGTRKLPEKNQKGKKLQNTGTYIAIVSANFVLSAIIFVSKAVKHETANEFNQKQASEFKKCF